MSPLIYTHNGARAKFSTSEDPSEVADGEEAGMHHPRTAVVATTTPVGAAASLTASRTAEVRTGAGVEGPVALLEAISEAGPGLGGRLLREPNTSNGCRRLFSFLFKKFLFIFV